jgi:hypothetical protein
MLCRTAYKLRHRNCAWLAGKKTQARKMVAFFECFPYVCPEPVLVKSSFIYINGSKKALARC